MWLKKKTEMKLAEKKKNKAYAVFIYFNQIKN